MSSTQILVLGAVAGATIFIGLPLGRLSTPNIRLKAALSALATGILLFLLYDVIHGSIEPVDEALTGAVDGGSWAHFAWYTALFAVGFAVGLMSLVYYDGWMKRKRDEAALGPGAASAAEFEQSWVASLSAPAWLSRVDRHRHRPAQLLRGARHRPGGRLRRDQPRRRPDRGLRPPQRHRGLRHRRSAVRRAGASQLALPAPARPDRRRPDVRRHPDRAGVGRARPSRSCSSRWRPGRSCTSSSSSSTSTGGWRPSSSSRGSSCSVCSSASQPSSWSRPPGSRRRAADFRHRPAGGRRGGADRRDHRRVPAPGGPARRAALDVGRGRDRGRHLRRRRRRARARSAASCRSASRRGSRPWSALIAVGGGHLHDRLDAPQRARAASGRSRVARRRARGRLGDRRCRDGVLRRDPRGLRDRGVPARRLRRVDAARSRPAAARCSASCVAVAIGYGHLPRRRRRSTSRGSSASPASCSCSSRRAWSRARCTPRTRPAGSTASRRRRSTSLARRARQRALGAADRHARPAAAPGRPPRSSATSSTRSRWLIYVLWPSGPASPPPPARARSRSPPGARHDRAHPVPGRGRRSRLPLALAGLRRLRRRAATAAGEGERRRRSRSPTPAASPPTLELAAGPTTFKVTNDGAATVTEFEVLDGDRILGEAENVAPGSRASSRSRSSPGDYTTYCPGGTSAERGTLDGHRQGLRRAQRGRDRRRRASTASYVEEQTAAARRPTTAAFVAAVKAGDVAKAKALYAAGAHPVRADRAGGRELRRPRPSDRRARGRRARRRSWTGFHPIEQALWVDGHDSPARARSPTSSMRRRRRAAGPRADRSSSSRLRSPTARSSCSTRCRSRRSPARRSATRTPTSSTSRPTSRARRPRSTPLRADPGRERPDARRRRSTQRFADVETALAAVPRAATASSRTRR